ncbi:MAG: hypothetical protein WB784_11130 [Rhodanobacteraceae bacterium]
MDRNTLRLRASLLILRLSVALVMLMWTIDKFVRPEHGSRILEHFYGIAGVGNGPIYVIAAAELILIALFALGLFKTWTYGLILLLHAASTLSSYQQYLHAFEHVNLLFFAAWPMLGACVALFLLRDEDRLASLGASE